ncbi:MAG: CapA family protein, partial [Bacteroidales bacterium]|nr:CapA family protein [Bacteroidales bacterium]
MLACSSVNIKTVGAGSNFDDASRPLFVDSRDTKVAIVNIAEKEFSIAGDHSPGANPLDPIKNYYQILDAKNKAAVVIVIIHGGNEYYSLPSPMQVKTCRFFAELGVTAVVGHHPHCYSGYEIYKGVPIFYSLGNFIFDPRNSKPASWYEGFFVRLEIGEGAVRKYEIFPYFQCKGKPGLKLMRENDEERFNERIFKLSQIIQNDSELADHWIRFCHKQEKYYLPALLGLNKVTKRLQEIKSLRRLIINKRRLLKLRNVITCEAHHDACLQIIDNLLYKL